ncbi:uncharacterized protein LOC141595665 [Silene latifolia]|uniref:uncharacterized protein LOC141595665 n=1 Tax=Silene latifolia TaxID=37657 RepID=UPI003D76DAF4
MPTRVAFKGVFNDKYLANDHNERFNNFKEDDYRPLKSNYVVHQTNNGDIRVMNRETNLWWGVGERNWIRSNVGGGQVSDTNPNILFEVIKIDGNVIVLRSRDNNKFCDTFTSIFPRWLNAGSVTDSRDGYMKVEEPLDTVRIYNHSRERILTYTDVDNGGTEPIVITRTLSEEVTETKAWRNSQSLTLGTSMSFSSGIPKLGIGLEITFEGQFTEEYEWSKTDERKRSISETVTVTVPPGKTARLLLMASSASFDIPFSYTQTDRYVTGEDPITTIVDDGIFAGSSVYYSYIKTEQSSL